jgi:hypothetical protein
VSEQVYLRHQLEPLWTYDVRRSEPQTLGTQWWRTQGTTSIPRKPRHLGKLMLQFRYIFTYVVCKYGRPGGLYRVSIVVIRAMCQSTSRLLITKHAAIDIMTKDMKDEVWSRSQFLVLNRRAFADIWTKFQGSSSLCPRLSTQLKRLLRTSGFRPWICKLVTDEFSCTLATRKEQIILPNKGIGMLVMPFGLGKRIHCTSRREILAFV